MLQSAFADCLSLDLLSQFQDFGSTTVIDISRGQIAEALVVATVIVVIDEGANLRFEGARQEVVFQQDAVLQSLMLSLDLALGLRMMWGAPNMVHTVSIEIIRQIGGHI